MNLQIPTINNNLDSVGLEVSDNVFGQEYNESLVHQLVVAYLAAGRSGTKGQKTRSEVSGGGAKPWKQKGSGRARAGSSRSPLWRTGGVTFAAKNRSYKQKLNKKMYRVGMRSIFSELLRQNRLIIKDDIYPLTPRTKELVNKIKEFEGNKVLIITESFNTDILFAARNLPNVQVCIFNSLSPVELVNSDKIIATTQAIKLIEERLG